MSRRGRACARPRTFWVDDKRRKGSWRVRLTLLHVLLMLGCCWAILLPMTTWCAILGMILIPSTLRCVELQHGTLLPRPKVLLVEFAQLFPYHCIGFSDMGDMMAPGL